MSVIGVCRRNAAAAKVSAIIANCRKAPKGPGIGGSIETMFTAGHSGGNMSSAKEQLEHFKGQVYTTIRPIAQRVAGQAIHIARIRRPSGKDKPRTKYSLQRSKCSVPQWVKSVGFGDDENVEVLDQHPVLDALERPNNLFTDWSLKYSTLASLELTGWAYWWMPVFKGRRQIWHVPTPWVEAEHDGKAFSGWKIRADGGMEEHRAKAEEVAPFWYPNPGDPMSALSPLEAGAEAVLIEEYIRRCQRKFFENGIHPSYAVVLGDTTVGNKSIRMKATRAHRRQIRNAVQNRLRGVDKYNDWLLLDRLIQDVKPISRNSNELDLVNSSKMAEGRVSRGHGVNPTITGENDGTNYAQAAVADQGFCRNTVNPKMVLLGKVMTIYVVPAFDPSGDLVLFFEDAEPFDPQMELQKWQAALAAGIVTVDEYRVHVLKLQSDMKLDYFLRTFQQIEVPRNGEAPAMPPALPAPAAAQEEDDLEEGGQETEQPDDGAGMPAPSQAPPSKNGRHVVRRPRRLVRR